MDIPEEAIVCRRNGLKRSRLAPLLEETKIGTDPFSGLILMLMFESQEAQGFWRPFFHVLPSEFDTPVFWSESVLDVIKDTPMYYETLELKTALRNIYTREILPLQAQFSALLKDLNWSFERFCWAISTLWNRAYWIDEDSATPGIVPLADMMNHWDDYIHDGSHDIPSDETHTPLAAPSLDHAQHLSQSGLNDEHSLGSLEMNKENAINQLPPPLNPSDATKSHPLHLLIASTKRNKTLTSRPKSDYLFDETTRSFRVISGWTFLPGDEVFTCYGRKDNETLLADYAFIIPNLDCSPSSRFSLDVSYAYAPYAYEPGYTDKFKAILEHIGVSELSLEFLAENSSKIPASSLSTSSSAITSPQEGNVVHDGVAATLPESGEFSPDPCHLAPMTLCESLPCSPSQTRLEKQESSTQTRTSLDNAFRGDDGQLLVQQEVILADEHLQRPAVVITQPITVATASKEDAGDGMTPPSSRKTPSAFQPPPLSNANSSESLLTDSTLGDSEERKSEKRSFMKIDPNDCRQLLAFCRLLQLSNDELDIINDSNAHELLVPSPPPRLLAGDEVERRALLEALRIMELQPILQHHSHPILPPHPQASSFANLIDQQSLPLANNFVFWYRNALHTATSQLRDYLTYCVQCIQ